MINNIKTQVSDLTSSLPTLTQSLLARAAAFQAGQVRHFYSKWCELTSDHEILSTVCGATIEFNSGPMQSCIPRAYNYSDAETIAVELELDKLLRMGVIVPSQHEYDEYISNIFTRPKKRRFIAGDPKFEESKQQSGIQSF